MQNKWAYRKVIVKTEKGDENIKVKIYIDKNNKYIIRNTDDTPFTGTIVVARFTTPTNYLYFNNSVKVSKLEHQIFKVYKCQKQN